MKSLKNFIIEKLHMPNSKSISFNFDGVDGVKELINSLEGNDLVSIENNTVTVNVTESNYTKLSSVKDIIEAVLKAERNSSKTTNNETYAQKIKGLENKMDELNAIKNQKQIGDTLKLKVFREGKEKEITVTLQEQP